jgi:hypothetical protein
MLEYEIDGNMDVPNVFRKLGGDMMRRFYTVDRAGSLFQDQIIGLTKCQDVGSPNLQVHIERLFPAGISRHGEKYLLHSSDPEKRNDASIELVFEYIRRSHFPLRPSRLQSVFAFESLVDATRFGMKYREEREAHIWIVQSEDFFEADMNLLSIRGSCLLTSYRAHRYWSGEHREGEPW